MNEVQRRVPAAAPVSKQKVSVKVPVASAPATRTIAASKKNVTLARGKKQPREAREPLKKRRKEARKALAIFLGVLSVVFIAIAFYAIWLPMLRIRDVTASGPHAEEAMVLALRATYGTHFFIAPRSSIFLIPEKDIRASILNEFPDIEAVSLSAKGLNVLTLTTIPRAEVFQWCGVTVETSDGNCYQANAEGLVFAQISPEVASSSKALKVYGPLDREVGESPIRARVSVAHRLPDVLRMIRAVEALGADVASLGIRADEADIYLASGTRVTYVIGREEQASGLAASVFPQLAMNDGSVVYVDLRFDGKAYYRKSGTSE